MSRLSECEIAVLVVSLPATTSRMKNEASSAGVSCSPSMLAVASAETRSSAGSAWLRSARPVTSSASSWPAVRIWVIASFRSSLTNSGSAPDRMMLVFFSTIA